MLFNSYSFALFLLVVFASYELVRSRGGRAGQNLVLVIASYVFYAWWDWRFLGLIWVSTIVDYTVSRLMVGASHARRRTLLMISLVTNLGILALFKYLGFFVDSAQALLDGLGFGTSDRTLSIILPVGISFYTFQTISYTVDVYRERIEASRSLIDFALYVAYFPQLVAGPIEKARRLLPQIQKPRPARQARQVESASALIFTGLFKKVALADPVARIVDEIYADPGSKSSLTIALGVLAFSIQIYGDFSGYSDIARGTSRLFGIELIENFQQPYLARSITEFWRTWHISLSNWLHEYLYVSLGGNRRGRRTTYRNLGLTMVLGGLWHGASWTFVVWGAAHGLWLGIHRAMGATMPRGEIPTVRVSDAGRVAGTFAGVSLIWVLFRADSLGNAAGVFGGLLSLRPGLPATDDLLLVAVAFVAMVAIDVGTRWYRTHTFLLEMPVPAQGTAAALMLVLLVVLSSSGAAPFIYFQF